MYLKYYEEVSSNYLQANGIPITPSTPFFINKKGEAVISKDSLRLNYTDFALICGVTRVTSHLFRKMFSQFLYKQKNLLCREMEEYTLCHSKPTAKRSYQNPLRTKALALLGTSYYRSVLGLQDEAAVGSSSVRNMYVSQAQYEREQDMMRHVTIQ